MRAVEQAPRNKKQKESRAKPARRSFAFHSPRPQLLKGPTKESLSSKPKPSDGDFVAASEVGCRCFLRSQPRRRLGLGHPLGRDPSRTTPF